jgi:hypothetical protein
MIKRKKRGKPPSAPKGGTHFDPRKYRKKRTKHMKKNIVKRLSRNSSGSARHPSRDREVESPKAWEIK